MNNEEQILLSGLETYPKIYQAVHDNWHTVWLDIYLNRLITDTNNHTRAGFAGDVFISIIKLQLANKEFLEDLGITDDGFGESKFGFDTGFWDIPKNF